MTSLILLKLVDNIKEQMINPGTILYRKILLKTYAVFLRNGHQTPKAEAE